MTPLPFDPDLALQSDERPFDVRSRPGRRFRRAIRPTLAVSVGGAVGGCARFGVEQAVPPAENGFPWGTFLVNISGAFLVSVLLILVLEVWRPTRYVSPLLAVGFLASFTTFSTFMVDADTLLADGSEVTAGIYLAATVVAGLASTSAGLVIGRGVANRGRNSSRRQEAR